MGSLAFGWCLGDWEIQHPDYIGILRVAGIDRCALG
jgi:hypothetical protein